MPAGVPIDEMLDSFNAMRDALRRDAAPLNERLRRVFREFRIVHGECDAIIVLPVPREDAHLKPVQPHRTAVFESGSVAIAGSGDLYEPAERIE